MGVAADGSAHAQPPSGLDLGVKFEVVRELGRGGMGVVYEARHRELGRRVAIKVMRGRTTPERALRFQREARAASDIDHPHIVRVLDLDRTRQGVPFIVMELLEGRDLAAELEADGPLPLARAFALLRGVADALDAAHARGIVHRDLKPQNIFVTRSGLAKVLDFGVCHYGDDLQRLTSDGQVVGTPLYMSPEQLQGAPPTGAGDVYALATILHELLTGVTPVEGASFADLLKRKRQAAAVSLSARAPGVPPAVDAVFAMALAVDPAGRPASAGAFLDALAAAAGLEVPTRVSATAQAFDAATGRRTDVGPSASASASASMGGDADGGDGGGGAAHGAVGGGPSRAALLSGAASGSTALRRQRRRGLLTAVVAAAVVLAGVALLVARPWGEPPVPGPGAPDPSAVGPGPTVVVAAAEGAPGPSGPASPAAVPPAAPPGSRPGGAAPTWPGELRLLVVPFESAPERETDRALWPLADRFVVAALEADERILRRLERVDPARVEAERERRELTGRLDADAVRELAAVLAATVVLEGAVLREGGLLHLRATLRPAAADAAAGVPLHVTGVDLPAAARALGEALRRTLWGAAPPLAASAEQAAQLLVGTPESVAALARIAGATPRDAREQVLREIEARDPAAVLVPWLRHLDNLGDRSRLPALAAAAPRAQDPEVGRFLASLAAEGDGRRACEGLDVQALGARYPFVLGPLAEAACLHRRGDSEGALRRAREAFHDLRLRPLAHRATRKLLFFARSCDEQLPALDELLRLVPGDPNDWVNNAYWEARCGQVDDALRELRVARALLPEDRTTACNMAHLGAWIHLLSSDPEATREWLDLIETSCDPQHPVQEALFVTALGNAARGRFRRAMESLDRGRDVFRERSDVYTMFVAGLFYMRLQRRDLDGARALVHEMAARFGDGADPGNAYMAAMLALALEHAERPLAPEGLAARLEPLGQAVVAALGDLGRDERDIEECMLASALGPDALAETVLARAAPSNTLLGGCRLRRAQRLLAGGQAALAADEFERALREILWARFLYQDLIAPALLGRAQALERAGEAAAARAAYEQVLANYQGSEDPLPEVAAAREGLARLP
jgi:serine/threonine-protein kinase